MTSVPRLKESQSLPRLDLARKSDPVGSTSSPGLAKKTSSAKSVDPTLPLQRKPSKKLLKPRARASSIASFLQSAETTADKPIQPSTPVSPAFPEPTSTKRFGRVGAPSSSNYLIAPRAERSLPLLNVRIPSSPFHADFPGTPRRETVPEPSDSTLQPVQPRTIGGAESPAIAAQQSDVAMAVNALRNVPIPSPVIIGSTESQESDVDTQPLSGDVAIVLQQLRETRDSPPTFSSDSE
jgi:hypothetical protein